jgi:phosphatidylinositol dimannoside acyltransferase
MPEAADPPAQPPLPARWSLYGDLPWRLLLGGVRACPSYLEAPHIAGWSFLIFLLAGNQRRAVLGNLKKLLPDKNPLLRLWWAWRTFYQFARSAVDGIRFQQGADVLAWEVAGLEHFEAAAAQDRPVMLCTAHMGSYDSAAACFAEKMGRHFFAVRLPERHPHLQQLREAGLRRMERGSYTALYNSSESVLGVELLRALQRRDWVAIQADRAPAGLTVLPFDDGQKTWLLPKGPFVLAASAGACCLPAFVRRLGHRRYRITFHPPLLPDNSSNRPAAVTALAGRWTTLLQTVIRQHPEQWLVFEPAFLP